MDDQVCPRCKTTKYRNPSLKLMVNNCGHPLCESCVDLLFLKGSGACPECSMPLRRGNFREKMFEDSTVEREVDIRRRILKDFNKKQDDFSTLREYNDYLEEVETIIFNLTYSVDILNTNKKIDQYKKDNRELILRNKSKLSREELELEEILEQERSHEECRKKLFFKEETEKKKKKIKNKEELLDQLMAEEGDAKNIVQAYASTIQKESEEMKAESVAQTPKQFSTGIRFGQSQQSYVFLPKVDEGPLYTYKSPELIINGPFPPGWTEVKNKGFMNNVRETTLAEEAGGYRSNIACMRALQEAFAGLYHIPENRGHISDEDEDEMR